MVHVLKKTIPAEFGPVKELIRSLAAFLESAEVTPREAYAVDLVVEEVLTNSVKYSALNKQETDIGLEIFIEEEHILLNLSDSGPAFDPLARQDPDTSQALNERQPGGLGILFVKKMTHSLQYLRKHGRNVIQAKILRRSGGA